MANEIYSKELATYLKSLIPEQEAEMQAMVARARETNFPIIGPAAGYFCYQMARMLGARRVFEMGSGFGYSTAWFAKAVRENGGGEVHHVVWDEKLSRDARKYLDRLGFGDLVQYQVGEAVQALREATGSFDLIFNDIDKESYPSSLPVITDKLRPGGLLIVDNMLWHGRVFDEQDNSESTAGIRKLTHLLIDSEEWVTTLVPIRDGLLIAYKN